MLPDASSLGDLVSTIFSNLLVMKGVMLPFPQCVHVFLHNVRHELIITGVDLFGTLLFAYLLFCLRTLVESHIGQRVASFAKLDPSKAKRLSESVWTLLYYIFASSLDGFFALRYSLLKDRSFVLTAYPSRAAIPTELWLYRLLQTGFYVQGFYGTLFVDCWRSDSLAMLLHHGITVALQALSYGSRLVWVGNLIEFIHDSNDVFLHLAKICNYFTMGHGLNLHFWNLLGTAFFAVFALSWVLTRILLYSYYIMYTVLYNGPLILSPHIPFSVTFILLLVILYALNAYWMILIWRIAIGTFIKKQSLVDIREYDMDKVKPQAPSQRHSKDKHD